MDFTKFTLSGTERHRLDNGLTILLREDHSVPVVTSMIWYRVGSRHETIGKTGLSHFLEHMMFKGTKRFDKGEIDTITARHGGASNAFTSLDCTAYFFSFASDRWWPALEIEAERMCHNRFDPDEFELERQVIMEELRMDFDTPWGALRHAVETNAFEKHPYRFPVIGLLEDLVSLRLDQLTDHYRRYYVPGNATLVVVGDFNRDRVLHRVEELFGSMPSVIPGEPQFPAEKIHRAPKRLEVPRPSHIPRLLIAFPAPSVRQPEQYAFQVLDRILSEGRLCRLYRRFVEQERIASLVTTEFDETFDPYLYFVRLELHEDADPVRAEQILYEELDRLASKPVTEEELRRSRKQCLSEFLEEFETTLDQGIQLGLLETLTGYEFWNTYAEQIEAVSAGAIQQVVSRYFRPQQATVGILARG